MQYDVLTCRGWPGCPVCDDHVGRVKWAYAYSGYVQVPRASHGTQLAGPSYHSVVRVPVRALTDVTASAGSLTTCQILVSRPLLSVCRE